MAGTRVYAERASSKGDNSKIKEVGLSGLGAKLSNTQILENELSEVPGDSGVKLNEEPVEIDMEGPSDSEIRESSHSGYPDLNASVGDQERTRSRSPKKQDGNAPRK